jgi:hypothetical protein
MYKNRMSRTAYKNAKYPIIYRYKILHP